MTVVLIALGAIGYLLIGSVVAAIICARTEDIYTNSALVDNLIYVVVWPLLAFILPAMGLKWLTLQVAHKLNPRITEWR